MRRPEFYFQIFFVLVLLTVLVYSSLMFTERYTTFKEVLHINYVKIMYSDYCGQN